MNTNGTKMEKVSLYFNITLQQKKKKKKMQSQKETKRLLRKHINIQEKRMELLKEITIRGIMEIDTTTIEVVMGTEEELEAEESIELKIEEQKLLKLPTQRL